MTWLQTSLFADILGEFAERQELTREHLADAEHRYTQRASGWRRAARFAARPVQSRACLTCFKSFEPLRRDQVRCSGKCRQRAQNANRPRTGTAPAWHWTKHRKVAA